MTYKQSFELPTYEQDRLLNSNDPEAASSSIQDPGALPAEDATPEDVRAYILALLIHEIGLAPSEARSISSKWTLGTGQELRKYPPQMYRELFGGEAGWAIYKAIKTQVGRDYQVKNPVHKIQMYLGIAIGLIVACNLVLILALSDDWLGLQVAVGLISTISVFGLVIIVVAVRYRAKPQEIAEAELLRSYPHGGEAARNS